MEEDLIITKTCYKCGLIKSVDLFYFDKRASEKNKSPRYSSYCLQCRSKNNQIYQDERIIITTEKLRKIKTENPCLDCGNYFPFMCMDFDHLDPENKDNNVGQLVSSGKSWNRIEREIKKCELVCSNCHRKRTYNRLMGTSF